MAAPAPHAANLLDPSSLLSNLIRLGRLACGDARGASAAASAAPAPRPLLSPAPALSAAPAHQNPLLLPPEAAASVLPAPPSYVLARARLQAVCEAAC